jgi:hypothetical protein
MPPNTGLRIVDSEIAQGIIEREKAMGIYFSAKDHQMRENGIWKYPNLIRLAGPDCWNKKPDYKGGGQGPSTAETFSSMGIYLTPGDPSRALKIRQFRERLEIPMDEDNKQIDRPMLQVYNTCTEFIKIIPGLSVDEDNVEDIDTDQEDHIYDEACHIVMARPLELRLPDRLKSLAEAHIDKIINPIKKNSFIMEATANKVIEEQYWSQDQDKSLYTGRTINDDLE